MKKFEEALDDANTCIQLKPNIADGYICKANMLVEMGQLHLATEVFITGLSVCTDAKPLEVQYNLSVNV